MSRPPATFLNWNLNICLRCQLRGQAIASQTTHRRPSHGQPNRKSHSSAPRPGTEQRTRNESESRKRREHRSYQSTSIHHAQVQSTSQPSRQTEEPALVRRPFIPDPGPVFRTNMRAVLRKWVIQEKHLGDQSKYVLPEEPRDVGVTLNNSLTRPEDLTEVDLEEVQEKSEEVEEALNELERLTEETTLSANSTERLRKGDMVELDFDFGVPIFAIYLGFSSSGGLYQYLTTTGQLFFSQSLRFTFRVPGFLDPSFVEAIDPYLPRGARSIVSHKELSRNIPQQVAAPFLESMARFQHDVEKIFRKYYGRIEAAQVHLAHPTDMRFMKVEELASQVLGPLEQENGVHPPHVLFAMTNALVKQTFGFVYASARTHHMDRLLAVYSKDDVTALTRVQEWVRAYQEAAALHAGGFAVPRVVQFKAAPLRDFAKRSAKIVEYSRATRRVVMGNVIASYRTDEVENVKSDEQLPQFTPSDLDIIRVLKLHGLGDALSKHPTLRALPNVIMRVVSDYEGPDLAESASLNFLVELGVLPPFFLPMPFDRHVWGPDHESDKAVAEIGQKIEAGVPVKTAANMQDSMAHLRKDWGHLRVFCIDGENTRDIDDGISIESVTGSPDEVWIHIHVAHISALVAHDSLLGKMARHRLGNQYFSSSRSSMLPTWAVQQASMSADKPVLTFSARLDADRNIVEQKVQPGIVRNVVQVSPQKIDREVFSVELPPNHSAFVAVGDGGDGDVFTPQPEDTRAPLTEIEKEQLRRLQSVSLTLAQKHPMTTLQQADTSRTSPSSSTTQMAVSVRVKQGTEFASIASTPQRPHFAREDPRIMVNTRMAGNMNAKPPSRHIVEEAMLLSGKIAAQWAVERNIPLIFTGSRDPAEGLEEEIAKIRAAFENDPSLAISRMLRHYGGTKTSAVPIEHKLVGTDSWAKVSNPLRKFNDLVTHWQLDAALRQEGRWGDSLVGSKENHTFLPYDKSALSELIDYSLARVASQVRYNYMEKRHWKLLFFVRAYLLGEIEKPEYLVFVANDLTKTQRGTLVQYGVQCAIDPKLLIRPADAKASDGRWVVEVTTVNIEKQYVHLKPIRRMEPDEVIPRLPMSDSTPPVENREAGG